MTIKLCQQGGKAFAIKLKVFAFRILYPSFQAERAGKASAWPALEANRVGTDYFDPCAVSPLELDMGDERVVDLLTHHCCIQEDERTSAFDI